MVGQLIFAIREVFCIKAGENTLSMLDFFTLLKNAPKDPKRLLQWKTKSLREN